MKNSASRQFQAGYTDGLNADQPLDAFEMSQNADDYALGYVVGYSEAESVRQASPMVWAWQAGELGRLYHVPLQRLEPFIDSEQDFNGSLQCALRDSYIAPDNHDDDDEFNQFSGS
jgi:hypothetical protein